RGPSGGNDEFVEIYNNSDNAVSIAGWKLMGSSNTAPTGVRATVPANVTLPGRSHYLFVNTVASGYSGSTPGNLAYTTGFSDNGGVALTDASDNIIDQVGITTTQTAYREGAPIPTQLTDNADSSYERQPGGLAVTLQDSNDNSSDFQLTTPSTPQNIVLVMAPVSIDFGTLVPPVDVSQQVTIRNLLTASVTLNAPAISGTDAGDFAAGSFASTTVAGGTTTTLTVTFQPTAIGHKSATLVVSSSLAGTATVPLTGNAITGIVVTPPAVDFGTVPPGSSTPTTLTIENTDPVNSVTLTPPFVINGTEAAAFSVGAPGTTFLGGADTTPLQVTFQPATPGPKSATLLVTSVQGGSRSIALNGLATCPAITVSGAPPAALVGAFYTTAFTATGGTSPYTFSLASGTPPSGLLLSADGTLSGNPSAPGTFTFTVQAAGANGCAGSATFTVDVTIPAIALTAAPTSINFGAILAPATATQTVTLTNHTSSDLTLDTPLTISGADASQFSVGAPGSATLAAMSSTTVVVTFAPTGPGAKSATLAAASIGGGTATVALSGNGASPVVISELRFRGPAGGNDEFVEIYNNTDAAIDVSGYTLHGSNNAGTNSTRATVPLNTTLPTRAHYLFINSAASGYSGTVAGNRSYATGITDDGGVALVDSHGVIVDQVGLSAGSLYKEGTTLASLGTGNIDHSYERKPGGEAIALQDTDDNSADFQLITPSNPQNIAQSVSPAAIDFGSVAQLTTHVQNVTIANLVFASLTVNAPMLGGTDAGDFAAGSPAATTLASGESTTMVVTIHPATPGTKSATLSISTSGGAVDVPLMAAVTADTTVPVLTVPADITTEATGAATVVTYTATALDPIDGPVAAACTPASGAGFPVGLTNVSCTATDPHGNSASSDFTVTVTDHTAPMLTVPANITTPATTASGALVTFTASAVDLVDGTRPVSCVPASGSVFALGSTTVTCSAADLHGNAASANFSVLVTPKNPRPPKVTAPKNIRAEATGPAGAIVTFDASATDPFDGTLAVVCVPTSGSMFSLGATLVTCSATNSSGRTDTDTAIITVRDTTDPTIVSLTPSVTLLPNSDQVVPVSVAATVTDIADPSPACRITTVAAGGRDLDNDGVIDWTITGPLTLEVQAVARKNKDRTYTITVKCTDASGNTSQEKTAVVVSRLP
ncbi:MAG: choice-of-anchor D domain-containing protein, partial [Vicinamibacterales bacterium]